MNISIEDYPVRHFSLKDADGNHVIKNMYDDNVQAFLSDVFEKQAEIDELVSHSECLVTLISTLWDKHPAYNHELSIEISDTIDKHEALIAKHR